MIESRKSARASSLQTTAFAAKTLVGAAMTALMLSGCSSDEAGETTATKVGAMGKIVFVVDAETGPQEGKNSFRIQLETMASHQPVEQATLGVSAIMPAMGHGGPGEPWIEELGGGAYRANDIVFSMPGTWEVRYEAAQGELSDEVTFEYDVP